jgi:hypothetical protein
MATYKIHPAIGFARLGNSTESYPGPTIPGVVAKPDHYRDAQGQLKRQGATFWVYAYDDTNPSAEPVKVKVGPGQDVVGIAWIVHVANKKSAWFLFDGLTGSQDILNPPNFGYPPGSFRNPSGSREQWTINLGPRTATQPGQTVEFRKGGSNGTFPETWPPTLSHGNATEIDTLGEMRVEADWGLTVLGGFGKSGSVGSPGLPDFANNPDWFDDTSDGSVTATLILSDGSHKLADPAWVIVAPPDFAPPIDNIVSMYDTMYDVGLRQLGSDPSIYDVANSRFQAAFTPSFENDIYPILRKAFLYRWVHNPTAPSPPIFHSTLNNMTAFSTPPSGGRDLYAQIRDDVYRKLRPPTNTGDQFDSGLMPKLYGDQGEGTALTLTVTQYEIMTRWRNGQFSRGTEPIPPLPPSGITASGLDRASLEAAVGGAFYPGIECGWIVREPRLYVTPFEFRFRHAASDTDPIGLSPGDVTKRSAVPWQADFNDCGNNWWPAQRPNQVRKSATANVFVDWDVGIQSHINMVRRWQELGMVVQAPGTDIYFEDERNLPRP